MRIEPKNPPPPVNFQVGLQNEWLFVEMPLKGYFKNAICVLLKGVGWLGQNSLREEEQNPQRRFQVSVHLDGMPLRKPCWIILTGFHFKFAGRLQWNSYSRRTTGFTVLCTMW